MKKAKTKLNKISAAMTKQRHSNETQFSMNSSIAGARAPSPRISNELQAEFTLIDVGLVLSDASILVQSLTEHHDKMTADELNTQLLTLSAIIRDAQLFAAKGNEDCIVQAHEYLSDDELLA